MSQQTKFDNVWRRCELVYSAIKERANSDSIWEGFTTKLFAELGISAPFYGETLHVLQELSVLEKVKRGSGGNESVWMIIGVLDREQFNSYMKARYIPRTKRPPSQTTRVRQLEARVTNLEEHLRRLIGGEFNEPEVEPEIKVVDGVEYQQTTVEQQIKETENA